MKDWALIGAVIVSLLTAWFQHREKMVEMEHRMKIELWMKENQSALFE